MNTYFFFGYNAEKEESQSFGSYEVCFSILIGNKKVKEEIMTQLLEILPKELKFICE